MEPCKRPTDGRFGDNPNRLQHYYQFQVIIKPAPFDIQDLYLKSLQALGIDPLSHDLRFVEDDWESPTLGAWGLGWEVWIDGMEITQFTYFQQVGGFDLNPIPCEITYGLERIGIYLQGRDNVFDLVWKGPITYRDIHYQTEVEFSHYNFERADKDMLRKIFEMFEKEGIKMLEEKLVFPAFDYCLKCSHIFNLLDARKAISVTERASFIGRVRDLAKGCASLYLNGREKEGFPLLNRDWNLYEP